jgi:PAS domain S-box-containing protein
MTNSDVFLFLPHTIQNFLFAVAGANIFMNSSLSTALDQNTLRALEAELQRETEARQKAEEKARHIEAQTAVETAPVALAVPLQEDAPFLRALLDNMNVGVMACNTAGELVLFNHRMSELLGRPLENVPVEHWAEHYGLHSVDGCDILLMHEVPLVRALDGQTVESFELKLKIANVPHRVLDVSAQPILDAQGRHLGAVCVARDITADKQTQNALRAAENRLSALLANLPVVVFAIDADGIFTFSDGLGLRSLGIAPSAVVGLSLYQLYQDYPIVTENIRKTLRGEHTEWQSEVNGITFQTQCAPLYDDKGQVRGATGVALDMTQRLGSEDALRHNEATPQNQPTRTKSEA